MSYPPHSSCSPHSSLFVLFSILPVYLQDHFNYLLGRSLTGKEPTHGESSLVGLVDKALVANDRATAEAFLTIDGGHGRVSTGWMIDTAVQPWREGTSLWKDDPPEVKGTCVDDCSVVWNGSEWDVYECTVGSVAELEKWLMCGEATVSLGSGIVGSEEDGDCGRVVSRKRDSSVLEGEQQGR